MPFLPGVSSKDKDEVPDNGDAEVLDDEPKNVLLSLISQLRIGMDLHKVALPVFVLEPRSMLERITDFMSHPDLIFGAGKLKTPEERFEAILRYYLAGWHIKPKGVKKPYNPVLGEFFRCSYDYPNGTRGYYIAEQTCHHPPISAFYYASPENALEIWGELRPKSKFLGNSAATLMDGTSKARLLDAPQDGVYEVSMPNMYARGLLFGKMILELGDESLVKSEENEIECQVEFKTKGFFSGTYNAIAGKIKTKNGEYGEISGKWSDVMEITRKGSGKKEVIFDAHDAEITKKSTAPLADQEEFESQRLWQDVTVAIKNKDMNAASDAKYRIEDAQRERAKEREAKGDTFVPRYFELKNDQYVAKFTLPTDKSPKEQADAVRDWMWPSKESKAPVPPQAS